MLSAKLKRLIAAFDVVVCTDCGHAQSANNFHSRSASKNGLVPRCRDCVSRYKKGHHARPEVRQKHVAQMRERYYSVAEDVRRADRVGVRREKRAAALIAQIRSRSKQRGYAFDLNAHVEDVQRRIDIGFCELTGLPFSLDGGRSFDSPSIDRVVPSCGYLHTNIRIILLGLNVALGDWGEDVFLMMADALRERRRA